MLVCRLHSRLDAKHKLVTPLFSLPPPQPQPVFAHSFLPHLSGFFRHNWIQTVTFSEHLEQSSDSWNVIMPSPSRGKVTFMKGIAFNLNLARNRLVSIALSMRERLQILSIWRKLFDYFDTPTLTFQFFFKNISLRVTRILWL